MLTKVVFPVQVVPITQILLSLLFSKMFFKLSINVLSLQIYGILVLGTILTLTVEAPSRYNLAKRCKPSKISSFPVLFRSSIKSIG